MIYTYGQQHKTTDDEQINMLDNLCYAQKESMKSGLNCIFKDIHSIVNYGKAMEIVRNEVKISDLSSHIQNVYIILPELSEKQQKDATKVTLDYIIKLVEHTRSTINN